MIHVKQNYRQADLTDLKLVQFQTSVERTGISSLLETEKERNKY